MVEAELQQLKEQIRTEILAELKNQFRLVPIPQPRQNVWGNIRAEVEKRLKGKFDLPTQNQILMAISTIIRASFRTNGVKNLKEEHSERAFKIALTVLDLIEENILPSKGTETALNQ
ncbi:MAG: hypothetical protein ACPLSY_03740 [Moorellaceae bacterium]